MEPIHIISLGAGVQSSTMALMAAAGEITPMPKCAIFADTQAEPQSVYKWLDWLEKQLPFPVHRVTRGSLEDESTTVFTGSSGKSWVRLSPPAFMFYGSKNCGPLMRQCTRDSKIRPIQKAITPYLKQCDEVLLWIGISQDEVWRMKDSRRKRVRHIWPLIDKGISRNNCLGWMEARNFPKPPRSACVFCPYHNPVEWRRLKSEEPNEFRRAVNYEKKLQRAYASVESFKGVPFLHSSGVPLHEVNFDPKKDDQLNLFNNECEGMCGV